MEKKAELKTKLQNDFEGMLRDADAYPVDEMIEAHKVKLGESIKPASFQVKSNWEAEDQVEMLRSQGKSDH